MHPCASAFTSRPVYNLRFAAITYNLEIMQIDMDPHRLTHQIIKWKGKQSNYWNMKINILDVYDSDETNYAHSVRLILITGD